ncbi:hypothetical protein OF83DRAFT_1170719 [Amylostereum chailletii]|nr:hypothetical protein OF83DRAFT_1170719 [Amylostereum chailletii]
MSFPLRVHHRPTSSPSSSVSPRTFSAVKPMVFGSTEAAYRYERAPAYAGPKWTADAEDDEPYNELNYDYVEDDDDFDQEPALTSDDATMPSSSRAPSLSPTSAHDEDSENVYVNVVSSSPVRDSFIRPRPATMRMEDKSSTQEDVVAALLSLARPRIGPSPLASAFPPPPILRPLSPSPAYQMQTPSLRIAVPPPRTPPRHSPEEERRTALIDTLAPAREDRPQGPTVRARSLAALLNPEPACPSLRHVRSATPERRFSPLPPSSPFSEEERDVEGSGREHPAPAVDDSADELHVPEHKDKHSSPLSRMSSLPPSSPIAEPTTPSRAELALLSPLSSPISEPDVLRAFELGPLSPLSSPPSSPHVLPAPTAPEASIKRSASTEPNAGGSRKKRKVNDDIENIPAMSLAAPHPLPPTVAKAGRALKEEPTSKKRKSNPDPDAAARKKKKRAPEDTAPKPPRSPQKQKQKQKQTASSSEDVPSDADCPHTALLSLLIESLALSRASSLPVSALYDAIHASYPALSAVPPDPSDPASSHPSKPTRVSRGASQTPPRGALAEDKIRDAVLSTGALSAVLAWGIQRGLFGELASSGDSVPPTYFYLPAADWDRARAGLWEAMGGRGKRAVARGYKQYYWQPVVLPRGGRRRAKGKGTEEGGASASAGWEVDWEE